MVCMRLLPPLGLSAYAMFVVCIRAALGRLSESLKRLHVLRASASLVSLVKVGLYKQVFYAVVLNGSIFGFLALCVLFVQ